MCMYMYPITDIIGIHTNNVQYMYTHKHTYSAAFPDVLERILPADGLKRVGHLFAEVLQEIGKLQNFAIYLEGSRVPLELDVDTSVLVGQKVNVKYLPGPCKSTGPPALLHTCI